MPAAFGLSPLLCHCSQSAAFEQERAEAAAHPAQEPAPGCWVLTTPSALRPIPPEAPSLPSNTGPPHRGRLWCSQLGHWLCPPRLGRARPLSWMGCKQTPILTKSKLERLPFIP